MLRELEQAQREQPWMWMWLRLQGLGQHGAALASSLRFARAGRDAARPHGAAYYGRGVRHARGEASSARRAEGAGEGGSGG